jgi:hypothetical protein
MKCNSEPRFSGVTVMSYVEGADHEPAKKAIIGVRLTDSDRKLSPNRKLLGDTFILTASENGKVEGYKLEKKQYLPFAKDDYDTVFKTKTPVTVEPDTLKPFLRGQLAFQIMMNAIEGQSRTPQENLPKREESPLGAFLRLSNIQLTWTDLNIPEETKVGPLKKLINFILRRP